jgi:hypothetical protein
MTDDEFKGLFGNDYTEIAEAMDEAEAAHKAKAEAAKPKKDGLWYVRDEDVPEHGHTISVYALNLGGKTVAWIRVDNDLEVPAEELAKLGKVPAGVTGHAIRIFSADGGRDIATTGIALRYPHQDGTHLDGQSIRAYVLPRASRFLGQLYGV